RLAPVTTATFPERCRSIPRSRSRRRFPARLPRSSRLPTSRRRGLFERLLGRRRRLLPRVVSALTMVEPEESTDASGEDLLPRDPGDRRRGLRDVLREALRLEAPGPRRWVASIRRRDRRGERLLGPRQTTGAGARN